MNASQIATQFEIASTPLPTCGRDLCFECCAGTCPDAVIPERADLERHAPPLPVWSEEDLAVLNAKLDEIDAGYDSDRAASLQAVA